MAEGSSRGCLVTNTLVELTPHDPEIAAAARSMLNEMEKAFRKVLQQAVEVGELPDDTNIRAVARFLTSTLQGLTIMGKATSSRATTRDIVQVAMSILE